VTRALVVTLIVLDQGPGCAREPELTFRPEPIAPLAVTPRLVDGSGHAIVLAGDEVVLHCWATWCAPCVAELPRVLALAREPGRPRVVCIATDVAREDVRSYFGGVVSAEVAFDDGTLACVDGHCSKFDDALPGFCYQAQSKNYDPS